MPSPLPQDAARLDAALEQANRLRRFAAGLRTSARLSFNPKPLLEEARKANAEADVIMAGMKEDEGHA